MPPGVLSARYSMEVESWLTDPKEVCSLAETNEGGLTAVKIELGLLAKDGGKTRPRFFLLGNAACLQLSESSANPHGNNSLVCSNEFVNGRDQLIALGAGGNRAGLRWCEVNRLNKWGELFARDPFGYSSCGYPIGNATHQDKFTIEIGESSQTQGGVFGDPVSF